MKTRQARIYSMISLGALCLAACSDECQKDTFFCDDAKLNQCVDGKWQVIRTCDEAALCNADAATCDCKDINGDDILDCTVRLMPENPLPELKELSELEGSCAEWKYPKHPVIEFPDLPEYGYETTIDIKKYNISNVYDVSKAEETTKGINQAIEDAYHAGYRRIIIPDGHYPIGYSPESNFTEGIRPLDGMALIMSDKVILQMIPTNTYDCNIINLRNRSHIYIEGGELIGEKYDHTMSEEDSTDEECNIITSYYSHHIFINKMKLRQSHGDGILIYDRAPSADKPQTSAHFILANSDFDDNFRQGISVVGVNGLRITHNKIHHTSGTSPQFGIDFEGVGRPNTNVIIDNNIFHDNVGGDIVNNDVYNLFVEYNTFSQGDMDRYIDNPFIPKAKSSYILYKNKFEKFTKSIGCGYAVCCSYGTDMDQPYPSFFVKNEVQGTRLMLTNRNKVCIKDNLVKEGMISATNLKEMRLLDNRVENYETGGIRYSFKDVYGKASGNIACNTPDGCIDVTELDAMKDNEAFGFNLHMW
ncbi:MAG: right-handed parallel beta-helix repeat-containing protein [Proteobacteria bacterium]|nr:right-handed parallel beta-helix repeat-containing protein [Pseudomonadota bacterium]